MARVDRTISGRGSSERAWADSPWLASMPSVDFNDLVGELKRIVVLSPHPDDETLGCGGLISNAQRRQLPVLVCSVTSGENCYPDHEATQMGKLRHDELLQAMKCLGLSETSVSAWQLPDGALAARKSEVRERLLAIVTDTDLLLAPWELDGHPDHEACGEMAAIVAAERGATLLRYPVWGWHWSDTFDGQQGLPSARGVRFPLDAAAMEAKRSAIASFKTQTQADVAGTPAVLSAETLARFHRHFEVYLT